MKKTIYMLAAAALLLAGCEKEIPLDTDGLEPKVVAMGTVEEGDTLGVRLTYSRLIYGWHDYDEEYSFDEIANATVAFKVNGVAMAGTMRDSGNYVADYLPQAGDKIDLKVNVPGYDDLSASTVVPRKPVLSNLRVTQGATVDYSTTFDVHFKLDDPAGESNYYVVRLYIYDTTVYRYDIDGTVVYDTFPSGRNELMFSCNDASISSFSALDVDIESGATASAWELYFTDNNIDGQNHEIHLTGSSYSYMGDEVTTVARSPYIEAEVVGLSRDRFLYEQSVDMARGDGGDLFEEPSQVHCNVKNGIGIFAGRAVARIKTKVEAN